MTRLTHLDLPGAKVMAGLPLRPTARAAARVWLSGRMWASWLVRDRAFGRWPGLRLAGCALQLAC